MSSRPDVRSWETLVSRHRSNENLGATWAQNPYILSANRRMSVSKGSRINVNFADLWSGNRTHVRLGG